MDPKQRQRWLTVLLPTIVVCLVYYFFFSRAGKLNEITQQVINLQNTAPKPAAVAIEQAKMKKLTDERSSIQAEKSELEKRWSSLAETQQSSAARRNDLVQQFTRILWGHKLFSVEESAAKSGESQVPASFEDMLKKVGGNQQADQSRVWKVKFYGKYSDVVAALEALRDLNSSVIPLGITMAEAQNETQWRCWTLILWI